MILFLRNKFMNLNKKEESPPPPPLKDLHPLKEKWSSRIPKHLSPKERIKWEKDLLWEISERKRREKEGFYPSEESLSSKSGSVIKKKIRATRKKRK